MLAALGRREGLPPGTGYRAQGVPLDTGGGVGLAWLDWRVSDLGGVEWSGVDVVGGSGVDVVVGVVVGLRKTWVDSVGSQEGSRVQGAGCRVQVGSQEGSKAGPTSECVVEGGRCAGYRVQVGPQVGPTSECAVEGGRCPGGKG